MPVPPLPTPSVSWRLCSLCLTHAWAYVWTLLLFFHLHLVLSIPLSCSPLVHAGFSPRSRSPHLSPQLLTFSFTHFIFVLSLRAGTERKERQNEADTMVLYHFSSRAISAVQSVPVNCMQSSTAIQPGSFSFFQTSKWNTSWRTPSDSEWVLFDPVSRKRHVLVWTLMYSCWEQLIETEYKWRILYKLTGIKTWLTRLHCWRR